jgi:putative alpha-1,2-mannosidase
VYVYIVVTAESIGNGSLPAANIGLWGNNTFLPLNILNSSTTSGNLGAFVSFAAQASDTVITVRSGLSFVDVSHAKANLYADQYSGMNWTSFNAVVAASQGIWNARFNQLSFELPPGISPQAANDNLTSFYTAMYHSLLAPTTYSESDGSYLGFDGKVHTVWEEGNYHSDMSIWDIHRSQAPLLILLDPATAVNVATSLLTMYQQGGHLPRWPLANIYTGCMVRSFRFFFAIHLIPPLRTCTTILQSTYLYALC